MTKDRSNFSFTDGVIYNAEKIRRDQSYYYLDLPKGIELFNPDPGTIKFDVIPYNVTSENHPDLNLDTGMAAKGEPWMKRPFSIHRNIGVDSETVLCLRSVGQKCPVCELWASMKASGADKDELDLIKQKERTLYWVVPLGSRKWDESVYLLDVSHWLFQKLLLEELKEKREYANFAHPIDGRTLQVRYSKESGGEAGVFVKANRIDFKAREHEYGWDVVDEMHSLDQLIEDAVYSYEELERLVMTMAPEDYQTSADFNKVSASKISSGRKKKSPLMKKKNTDNEDTEPEEDLEPEEEESRKKKSPLSRTKTSGVKTPFKKKTSKDDEEMECPFGHQFGVDTDGFNDCEECALWDPCNDTKKANQ